MQRASIKMAILIPSLAVLVAGIIAVISVVGALSANSTNNLTDLLLDARVNQYSNEFRAFSEDAYGTVATIAPLIANFTDPEFSADVLNPRAEVVAILSGALQSNDKIVSFWTCWEPDAFDGKDKEYAGTEYHDATGRFVPIVYSDGNDIVLEALQEYDDPVGGEYYQGPRKTGKPYATDPYPYEFGGQTISIFTISIPILKDGKVIGVVGADLNLQSVTDIMNAGSILDDGYFITISPGGLLATHPNTAIQLTHYDTGWIGGYRTQIDSIIANGGSFMVDAYSDQIKANVAFLCSGLRIGGTDRYWVVCGIIPEKTVNADTNSLLATIIALGVALIALVGITIFLIVRSRLKDLPNLTATAEAIAIGDVNFAIPDTGTEATQNEITLLMRAFSNMSAAIQQQAGVMSQISQGDYSISIPVRSDKDVINQAINAMLDSTNATLNQISLSSAQVSVGSRQIADGAQTLAQGATEQASTVQELSASISDVASKTEQNAVMAKEASELSGIIKQNAEKGSVQMDHMMQAVKDINEASNQISKIIKVIDDISFQTNILALNAAVEAAHASQHGKGFAVVADEVRNLAAKSADAAKNTEDLIANSIEKANMGFTIASETAESLKDIVDGINRSVEIVGKIAQSSDEQSSAITMINSAVDQVAQVVQQNSATAEESAAASQEMSGQSNILEDLLSQFKLKDAQSQFSAGNTRHKRLAMPEPEAEAFKSADNNGGYGKY